MVGFRRRCRRCWLVTVKNSLRAGKELFPRAQRPNLFIKIPGIPEGIPAIEETIFAGVPVNVTLLLSREQYLKAAGAFLRGIQRRLQLGLNPNVGSVASVLVSRWDAAVKDQAPDTLRNQLGIAMAMRTYRAARDLLTSPVAEDLQCRRPSATSSFGRARAPRIPPHPEVPSPQNDLATA